MAKAIRQQAVTAERVAAGTADALVANQMKSLAQAFRAQAEIMKKNKKDKKKKMSQNDLLARIVDVEEQMKRAADNLDFEQAIMLRKELMDLRRDLEHGKQQCVFRVGGSFGIFWQFYFCRAKSR